jgi:outer membrane protein assembly factor BamE (lipoprotein component of BamABCDE complex)
MRRTIAPLMLVALGIWLMAGCLYIPTFNATVHGPDASESVGGEGSTKPLKPGATRDAVQRVLGKPYFATSDGRYWVYSWEKRKGILVWPLCFSAKPEDRAYALTLEFKDNDIVHDFMLEQGHATVYLWDVRNEDRFVPPRVMVHQMELKIARDHPEMLEEFRATTRRTMPQVPAPQRGSPPPPAGPTYRTENGK